MGSMTGKTVLITGASSGIGHACACAFAAAGARLLLCARRTDRLVELTRELASTPAEPDIFSFRLDVRDADAVIETLANLPEEWREIDILINNAGLSRGLTKLYEDDPQNWDEMLDTNVKGLLYVTRAIVPGMVARGRGHVISLGSIAGHQTYPNGAVYCASKAAERAISDGLRLDLIGTPVRVSLHRPRHGRDRVLRGSLPRRHRPRRQGLPEHHAPHGRRHRRDDPLDRLPPRPRQHSHHPAHQHRSSQRHSLRTAAASLAARTPSS